MIRKTVIVLLTLSCAFSQDINKILKKIEKLKTFSKTERKIEISYDPFFPTKKKKVKKKRKIIKKRTPLKLKAILNKEALINGKWLKEGSRVGNYKIIKIEEQRVWLKRGQKTILLKLYKKPSLLKVKEIVR